MSTTLLNISTTLLYFNSTKKFSKKLYYGNLKVCWLKKITTPFNTDNSLSATIKWYEDSKFCLTFKGNCLNQNNATYTPPNRINFSVVYELDTCSQDLNSHFNLKYFLFRCVKLAKNSDSDKYVYSRYSVGSDSRTKLSLPDDSMGKNDIIFGVDMSSSVHIDNKKYHNSWIWPNKRIGWYYVNSRSSIFNYQTENFV